MNSRKVGFLLLLVLVSVVTNYAIAIGNQSTFARLHNSFGLEIDDFEDVSDWEDLTLEAGNVQVGDGAGRWNNHTVTDRITKDFATPLDASGYDAIQFWAYSEVANDAQFVLIFDSDNDADPEGWDYYNYEITVDWTGWRLFSIPKTDFSVARNPVGWQEINYVRMSADGWGNTPQSDTDLIFDQMAFVNPVITNIDVDSGYSPTGDFDYHYSLTLQNETNSAVTVTVSLDVPSPYPFLYQVVTPSLTIPANGSRTAEISISIPESYISPATVFEGYTVTAEVSESGNMVGATELVSTVPTPQTSSPNLFLDSADFVRINNWAATYGWADNTRTDILEDADDALSRYESRYGVTGWAIPPEGGQWSLWYICDSTGRNLQFIPPNQHYCADEDAYYTGWPYDQVIYEWRFRDLARAAVENGLAYQLTGDVAYAGVSAEILTALEDTYLTFPLHDRFDEPTPSGARAHAQTLNEALWIIDIAWAYDLIFDSTALTDTEKFHIENNLLREAADVILRNLQEENNWQSWHNAALTAVGYAVNEPALVAFSLNDSANGFYSQMSQSVLGDGFWYEGAWGYHFFTLDALTQHALMSQQNGIDLFSNPELTSMYFSPINFARPDGEMPRFNDDFGTSIYNNDFKFEVAYAQYGDEILSAPLPANRWRDGLLFGAETVPTGTVSQPESAVFADSGIAILRHNDTPQPLYLALDYGPHGGWHGHPDKLGFVLYAQDQELAVDPGTHAYGAPIHNEWDKSTVAHNTVVIDESNQAEATGTLHTFHALPSMGTVSADAGNAYTTADLQRTLVTTNDYVIDHYFVSETDGQSHQIDWVYHNLGTLSTTLNLTSPASLPTDNGYQHLTDTAFATTSQDWQATFQNSQEGADYGSYWASEGGSGVTAEFTLSAEQAYTGSGSGKISYDFSPAPSSYILFTTEDAPAVSEIPDTLTIAVYGDNSGNDLRLRVYDANNERFIYTYGPIDWTGWREITLSDISSWATSLGDGVFDIPATQAAVQINHVSGSPTSSSFYVDDITLTYPAGSQTIADFALGEGGLHVWSLGQPNTTVVTGDGVAAFTTDPVPFVMMRRQSASTAFTTLLEPIADAPEITSFETISTNAAPQDGVALAISTATSTESLLALNDPTTTTNSFGSAQCNGTLCAIQEDANNNLQRLILADGETLTDGGTALISADNPVSIQVEYVGSTLALSLETDGSFDPSLVIYAPNTSAVTLDGDPISYTQNGNNVRFDSVPTAITLSTTNSTPISLVPLILVALTACLFTTYWFKRQ